MKDDGTSMGKVYELGGPDLYTVHELVISGLILLLVCPQVLSVNESNFFLTRSMLQAELMFEMIREWPRYVKVPLPIAKVIIALCV